MKKTQKIRNVLVCGNYGIQNLGDEAILAGLLKLLSSTWPGTKLTVMSSNPVYTTQTHKINSVKLFPAGIRSFFKFWASPIKTISSLKNADVVFLGGGGLFNDEKWPSIFVWFAQFLWFWVYRKPLVCVAQSVGPLQKGWSKFLVKIVFKYAKLVTVRDKNSANLLSKMGVKNVYVLADPAFAVGYDSAKSRNKQDQIIISIRPWQSHNMERLYKEIAHTIDLIFEQFDLRSLFLPFQTQIENDGECFKSIHRLLRNKEALKYETPDDYLHAIEIIGRSRMVIGMRLHSVIFSTLATTPFLAISYSSKVTGYVDSIQMNDFLVDSKNFKFDEMLKKVTIMLDESKSISNRLEQQKLQKTYAFFEHEKLLKSTFNFDV